MCDKCLLGIEDARRVPTQDHATAVRRCAIRLGLGDAVVTAQKILAAIGAASDELRSEPPNFNHLTGHYLDGSLDGN